MCLRLTQRTVKLIYFQKPTNLMADPIPTRFRLIFTQPRSTMIVS
jgi:hypothetical protein